MSGPPRRRHRSFGVAACLAALAGLVAAGCGVGPGEGAGGPVTLTVTRDFGAREVLRATEPDPPASETVLRLLDRRADVETAFGGGFVQSIDGIDGTGSAGLPGGRRRDWFFYVNGIESGIGAADVTLNPGDAVWWDYREWSGAMRVPAVVGSFPEPFVHGEDGKGFPTRIDCLGEEETCQTVSERLQDAGIPASLALGRARAGQELIRVVVGPWDAVRNDQDAAVLDEGPESSGVFGQFESGSGGLRLVTLDERGGTAMRLDRGGLVAAVRADGTRPPTWLVTGVDDAAVVDAAGQISEAALRDSYAVATDGPEPMPLPER